MNEQFKGTGVALATPFKADESVDFEGLKNLLQHTIEGGVDYLVVNGTTAESPTLSSEEKQAILETVKEYNSGQKPIVYGLGGNNTQEVLHKIDQMDFTGIDGILSVCPYYNKPGQGGIKEHFKRIADKSPVPVIIYNVPGRTGVNIKASTTIDLAQHENIAGIKESSGDFTQCMAIANNKSDDFLLISGEDLLTFPMIAIGGAGGISVISNALPQFFSRMVHHGLNNEMAQGRRYLNAIATVNPTIYDEGNPTGIKQALALLGICENKLRLPLVPASQELKDRMDRAFKMII